MNYNHKCFLSGPDKAALLPPGQISGLHEPITLQEVNSLLLSGKIFRKWAPIETTFLFYLQKLKVFVLNELLHGIIFLWTELQCWSEMHRPEIPSHHLSYSSSSLLEVTTLQTPTLLLHFYPLKKFPPWKDPAVVQSVYPSYCSPLPVAGASFSFGLPRSSELVLSRRGEKNLKHISEIGKCRVFTQKCILVSKPMQLRW